MSAIPGIGYDIDAAWELVAGKLICPLRHQALAARKAGKLEYDCCSGYCRIYQQRKILR